MPRRWAACCGEALREDGHAVDLVCTGADAVWLGMERD
jgi:hypothetical protein